MDPFLISEAWFLKGGFIANFRICAVLCRYFWPYVTISIRKIQFFFILGTRCRHTGGIHIWVAIANVTGSTHVLRHNWISYKKQSQPWSWSCNSIYSAEKRVKQPHQATVRADNCDVNALLALSHFHGIRLGSYHPICAVQVLISRLSTSRVFTSETFNKQERNNW